jgi:hypothetical protein
VKLAHHHAAGREGVRSTGVDVVPRPQVAVGSGHDTVPEPVIEDGDRLSQVERGER